MEIFKNELYKLISNEIILLILFLVALNPLILIYVMNTPNDDGYTQMEYSNLYKSINVYEREDILSELEKAEDNANTFGEMNLYSKVKGEIEAILSYNDYLEQIDEKTSEVVLFGKVLRGDGYAEKNAEKTRLIYQGLKGKILSTEDPSGVITITNSKITDYISVLIVFFLAVGFVFFEKNDNKIRLLRTTRNGRKKLMTSKIHAMIFGVIISIFTIYISNLFVSIYFYGLGNLDRPVQSIYLYRNSPYEMSVGIFLIRYFIIKILGLFLLGLLFMFICILFDRIVFVFLTSLIVLIIELFCYTQISVTGNLAFLKYMNMFYGVKTEDMFSEYINIDLFGNPVNSWTLFFVMWSILCSILTVTIIFSLNKSCEKRDADLFHIKKTNIHGGHTSLIFHECYKMLLPGRCLVILIILCVFVIWWNPVQKMHFDSVDEIYYKDYINSICGPLNDNVKKFLADEKKKYEELSDKILSDTKQGKSEEYINIKYRDELERQNAFNMLKSHVEYLEAVDGGWLFFDKGFSILTNTGNHENRNIPQAYIYIILIIALTSGIYSVDYTSGEIGLLNTSYYGRKKINSIKTILGIFCAFVSFVLIYVIRIYRILEAYGTIGIDAPVASIEQFAGISNSISVREYLLIIMAMRILGGFIISFTVIFLFHSLKNSTYVICVSLIIFLAPLVLYSMGVPSAKYLLCNPLLIGDMIMA